LVKLLAIDHVQLAMPRGEEVKARAFYSGVLGMSELPKPVELEKRGGAWFQSGAVQLHLGVEDDFRAAKKAHVAIGISGAEELKSKLRNNGHAVREDHAISGVVRFFTDDAFGNRLEFICQE